MAMEGILTLNGPNLNLLGERKPEVYGRATLADIEDRVQRRAEKLSCEAEFAQDNSEGELVGEGRGLQPGRARRHYGLSVREAISAIPFPVVEVQPLQRSCPRAGSSAPLTRRFSPGE